MLNDKLNKKEDEVMNAVFTLSNGKDRVLVTPGEIIALLPPKLSMDEESLEEVLHTLELDGYFELTVSERKGEKTYVVNMLPQGAAYKRSNYQRKRGLYIKIGITIAMAILSFTVGMILKAIF